MTGNKMVDNIIVGLLVLATGAALGVFIYTEMVFEKELPSNDVEKISLLNDSKLQSYPETYKLDKMIINLHSRKTRLRFLDIQVYLVTFKKGVTDLLDRNKPVIYDAIIDIAGQMNPDELNSVHGKILLESRIKKRINQLLGTTVVREIQFSKFVVQ